MDINTAGGMGRYKTDDFILNFYINVRPDSQIPDFDSIIDAEIVFEGVDVQEAYTAKVKELTVDTFGTYLEDILKIKDIDIINMVDPEVKAWDSYPVFALRALKKAIFNYLDRSGQTERLAKYLTKVVCKCRNVTDTEILDVARKFDGDLEKVIKITGASTGCKSCTLKVQDLVKNYKTTGLGQII